jgi:hypothetical protein
MRAAEAANQSLKKGNKKESIMKNQKFVSPTVLLGATFCAAMLWPRNVSAQPAKTTVAKTLAMPPEVRAMTAPGATTLKFARLPIGIKGAPVLMHAWRIERGSSQSASGEDVPAPVCVDFFSNDAATGRKWELVASTSYLSKGSIFPGGTTYSTYWLRPKTKQGLVVVETNTGSTGSTLRLITLPQGVASGRMDEYGHPVYVQEFSTSSSGGESSSISFKRDARGQMTVEEQILPHAVAPQVVNTYAWKGERWTKVASRSIKQ